MSYTQPPTLHENQSDNLIEDLSKNPLLEKSNIPFKNKALNTTKQSIILAINEILASLTSLKSTLAVSLDQQKSVIGDFLTNPILKTELEKIDASILASLSKIYRSAFGDLDNPEDISELGTSLAAAILTVNDKVQNSGGGSLQYQQITKTVTNAPEEIVIPVQANVDYNFPPVEVLKESKAETTNVVIDFNAEDAKLFEADPFVVFDGKMHLKTTEQFPLELSGQLEEGKVYKIDLTSILTDRYKTLEKIEIINA